MGERARCVVFAVLLVVAVVGAAGLMTSGLLGDPGWRTGLQIAGTGAAVGCGTACTVLAWRWWSGQWTEDRSRSSR